nr:hypothetical protein Iba_chr01bCG11620 [Ipomoea batatas]
MRRRLRQIEEAQKLYKEASSTHPRPMLLLPEIEEAQKLMEDGWKEAEVEAEAEAKEGVNENILGLAAQRWRLPLISIDGEIQDDEIECTLEKLEIECTLEKFP